VDAPAADADLIELLPLSVGAGAQRLWSATNWWLTFSEMGVALNAARTSAFAHRW